MTAGAVAPDMLESLQGFSARNAEGALRECLIDPHVTSVLSVGRSPAGQQHPKLREIVHCDFRDFTAIEFDLSGYDACSSLAPDTAQTHQIAANFKAFAIRVPFAL
ncbi:hypothetical protein [Bradyrhizobium sp.]|uniref:hypothetical protein n=1 Tax=Bradyrhizobium sp. TaxID=376 RepID=UPI002733DC5A|nr:hypothetical protein [Bradyrhizobium sp.]MDP3075183.1 hypothetical protein [Bradyrhizobium sp.]